MVDAINPHMTTIPFTDEDIELATNLIEKHFSYSEPTGYAVETCQLPNGKWLRVEKYPDDIYKYYVHEPHTYKKGRTSDTMKRIARLWMNLGKDHAGMNFTQFMAKMLKYDGNAKRRARRMVPRQEVHDSSL